MFFFAKSKCFIIIIGAFVYNSYKVEMIVSEQFQIETDSNGNPIAYIYFDIVFIS